MSPEPANPEPGSPEPTSPARPPGLAADIVDAGRGLLALVRADPRWASHFDMSTGGFVRSFFAPALALPLDLLSSALVEQAMQGGQPASTAALGGAALGHVLDTIGFPLLIALIARPLRIAAGYVAFVVVINWASLYLNLLLAAASLVALAGQDGLQVFSLLALILLCLSVFCVWRAAWATLTHEFAPILLVAVLFVWVDAVANQAAGWLMASYATAVR